MAAKYPEDLEFLDQSKEKEVAKVKTASKDANNAAEKVEKTRPLDYDSEELRQFLAYSTEDEMYWAERRAKHQKEANKIDDRMIDSWDYSLTKSMKGHVKWRTVCLSEQLFDEHGDLKNVSPIPKHVCDDNLVKISCQCHRHKYAKCEFCETTYCSSRCAKTKSKEQREKAKSSFQVQLEEGS